MHSLVHVRFVVDESAVRVYNQIYPWFEQDEEVAAAVRAAIKVLRSRNCLAPSIGKNTSVQSNSEELFEVTVREEGQARTYHDSAVCFQHHKPSCGAYLASLLRQGN